jgi:hypothetical protein
MIDHVKEYVAILQHCNEMIAEFGEGSPEHEAASAEALRVWEFVLIAPKRGG